MHESNSIGPRRLARQGWLVFDEDLMEDMAAEMDNEPFEPEAVGAPVLTMVYDWRTGVVTLHSGDNPGGPELVRGRIDARLPVDAIRIGASDDANINVRQVVVRVPDTAAR